MMIGILGSDDRAVAIGRLLHRAGNGISFSDPPHGMDKAETAAAALGNGSLADSAYHQAASCDMLVMAVRWDDLDTTLTALGPVGEKIVIDAMQPPPIEDSSGAECLAHKLDSRRVVEAFVKPIRPGDPIELCSDDPEATSAVAEMIRTAGYTPVDGGPLSYARELERTVAERAPVNTPEGSA
jgi:predicted dinucleotide-binding enzyme